jgi:hypothetical protein
MENFQLYRTNLALGGQMKWDLVVDNKSGVLHIANFNLTPISNNVSYTRKVNNSLLNNTHKDNVKEYYKHLGDNFYNEGLAAEYTHNWPIVINHGDKPNIYSNIYDMGCKRTKFYNLYNKQFEFLCPVWIENLTKSIEFKFVIKAPKSKHILSSKVLKFTKNNISEFHNKFIEYFYNHIIESGQYAGNDNVMNIQFDKKSAYVYGLNARTGMFETLDVSHIISDLTAREMPLMKFDDTLLSMFTNNNIICSQLYNFNFCFNLNDIMSNYVAKMLYGKELIISMHVTIDGKEIVIKDFYTEYEHIDRDNYYSNAEYSNIKLNVLDYLNDYSYIDYINKNKYCQKICHWSLCDNNEYIFNLYKGFGGYCVSLDDNGETHIIENSYQYGKSPDTGSTKFSESMNNAGWLNYEIIDNLSDFENIYNDKEYKHDHALLIKDQTYINDLKYDLSNLTYNGASIKNKGMYLYGICADQSTFVSIYDKKSIIKYMLSQANENALTYTCMLLDNNIIYLVSPSMDGLTFASVYNNIYCLMTSNKFDSIGSEAIKSAILFLYDFLRSKRNASIIPINASIGWKYCLGPAVGVKEIEYCDNDDYTYVIRYDGKIKPTFIAPLDTHKNTIYYKDIISDTEVNGVSNLKQSIYNTYSKSYFEPIYPSINYTSIKKIQTYDYNAVPEVKVSEYESKINLINDVEYSWFNDGVSLFISPMLSVTYLNKLDKTTGKYESLDNIAYKIIQSYYKLNDDKKIRYILSMYDMSNSWEYASENNVDDYIYNITFKMK